MTGMYTDQIYTTRICFPRKGKELRRTEKGVSEHIRTFLQNWIMPIYFSCGHGKETNFRQDYRIDRMGNKNPVYPVILSKKYHS
jgi:hypothetical protein